MNSLKKQEENWHKKNSSAGNVSVVKEILEKEEMEKNKNKRKKNKNIDAIPFFYDNKVHFQFSGWAIVLCDDGQWYWEDTTGG